MKWIVIALPLLLLVGCDRDPRSGARPRPSPQVNSVPASPRTLAEARRGFQTKLPRQDKANEPVADPPASVFRKVAYDSPVGKLAAYLSPASADGKKHAAIIWITGGDCNTIGDVWSPAPPSNDQSARAFREAGLVMMFPSLRGGNQNPGAKEGFLGEVDDVLAAADFLAKQEYVDGNRIYLGGHSSGGTLALLAAESTPRFRAVFSFGPVPSAANCTGSAPELIPFDVSNRRELELRSPALWLAAIQSPVFVFEGTVDGSWPAIQVMAKMSTNPKVCFYPVRGANHFSVLAPTTQLIASKVARDDGATCNVAFTEQELNGLAAK